jgi:hypothetical protein
MNPKLKKGLLIGGGLLLAVTITMFVNNKVKKVKANKPCKGKKCAEGIVGKTIKIAGSKANLRTSPSISSSTLIGSVKTNPIGKVVKEVKGADGFMWYLTELTVPFKGNNEAYVREDVIIL